MEVLGSKRKTALESKIRKRLLILMTCSVGYSAFLFVLGDFRARQDLGDACAIPAKRFKGVGEDHHIIGSSSNTPFLSAILRLHHIARRFFRARVGLDK